MRVTRPRRKLALATVATVVGIIAAVVGIVATAVTVTAGIRGLRMDEGEARDAQVLTGANEEEPPPTPAPDDTVLQNTTVLGLPELRLAEQPCEPDNGTKAHLQAVRAVAFSADATLLASGSEDGTVRVWNTTGDGCTRVAQVELGAVPSAIVGLAGRPAFLVGTAAGGLVLITGTADGWIVAAERAEAHEAQILGLVELSPGVVVSGATDRRIHKWELAGVPSSTGPTTGTTAIEERSFTEVQPAPGPVAGLVAGPNGTVAAALLDGPVVTVDPRTGRVRPVFNSLELATGIAPLGPDDLLVSGDGAVWAASTFRDGPASRNATAGWRVVNAVATLPGADGAVLAIAGGSTPDGDGPIVVLELADGRRRRAVSPDVSADDPALSVAAARISGSDRAVFAAGHNDGTVRLFFLAAV